MITTVSRTGTSIILKLIPTTRASMLVAMAIIIITLKFRGSDSFFPSFFKLSWIILMPSAASNPNAIQ